MLFMSSYNQLLLQPHTSGSSDTRAGLSISQHAAHQRRTQPASLLRRKSVVFETNMPPSEQYMDVLLTQLSCLWPFSLPEIRNPECQHLKQKQSYKLSKYTGEMNLILWQKKLSCVW